ncbi:MULTISPECIES: hypothetical protein [unclassified Microcoleus]|uniref:hypothetical protein n=1 Tax=unclassified Microcoleus TaxID=2642155 RepID=UPI002FD45934
MDEYSRKLKQKYFISWAIMGSVIGLVISVASLFQQSGIAFGTMVMATLIGGPGAMLVLAGMGFFIEGLTKYNWRFGEIEHKPWIWHIYPIFGCFLLIIGFGSIAISMMTLGKFGR